MFVFKLWKVIGSILLCAIFVLGVSLSLFKKQTELVFVVPNSTKTVVIDAGHGGIDGGCVGKRTKVKESDLNLQIAISLAEVLNKMDISCVLTRTNKNGLYDDSAKNLKKSDMLKRKEVIDVVNPDVVISIHMNSFPLSSANGAQAFYKKGSEVGKILADDVQKELHDTLDNAKQTAKVGDYYMVNCTDLPAVLVECGYLSNPSEEDLLQDKNYQTRLCMAIARGIVRFLDESKTLSTL